MDGKRFVLAIDGGGMRGIVPAKVIAYLERQSGVAAARAFDLIGGTSTGGILAIGLTKPDAGGEPEYAAADLLDLYVEEGHRIFHESLWWKLRSVDGFIDNRYSEHPLEEILKGYFGATMTSEAITEVILTAYDIHASAPFIFKRSYARQDQAWDYPMWWLARSTSAAPTYFDPFPIGARLPGEHDHVLVDGGVFANNPALCAYVEALDLWRDAGHEIFVCSIGTGERRPRQLTKKQVDGWGAAQWATVILDTVFDGVADTVDYELRMICRHREGDTPRYRRFQIEIPEGMSAAMDNATPGQVERLQDLGDQLVELRRDDLDALAAELRAHALAPR